MKKTKNSDVTKHRYSVIIQWSEDDQVYIATLPEWGGCHTHGATYAEAAQNASEVLDILIESEEQDGHSLPPAHEFMYPGPTGFSYEFRHSTPSKTVRKVRHAVA